MTIYFRLRILKCLDDDSATHLAAKTSINQEELYMKKSSLFITLILIILWIGCSDTPTESLPAEPVPAGAFSYTSYDTTGAALISGWFTMSVSDSGIISGEWHFNPVGNPQNIGPQTGEGNLVGGMEGDTVWIELNPQYADYNLQLHGILQGDNYSGEWRYISFPGITNHGTFEANRN